MPTELSEHELCIQAAAGQRWAIKELVGRHHAHLLRFVGRELAALGKPQELAEEIVHDTYLRCLPKLGRFVPRSERSFLAWLKKIAARRLIDLLRHQSHEPRAFNPTVTYRSRSGRSANELGGLVAQTTSLIRKVINREQAQRLQAAFALLPEQYRTALRLRYVEGYRVEQIADAMHCSAAAAHGLLKRAKQKLRAILAFETSQ
ncbi:MAG TPA: RNA polymerase sigma factor [Pirellulales bacterium]|jgi:RNA polymerase sigma-70 factor (ECF subfamily)|nr:RNA polymerase sigma factor [Pirellulales bacterium]